ncbi:hypothetical protein F4778DRAFT_600288 [Xylariomycetidae sp. FL2044]|nr:hypothetical protein F4778DRAFT_600288 [Xylariomycetidae sp. FL2044]
MTICSGDVLQAYRPLVIEEKREQKFHRHNDYNASKMIESLHRLNPFSGSNRHKPLRSWTGFNSFTSSRSSRSSRSTHTSNYPPQTIPGSRIDGVKLRALLNREFGREYRLEVNFVILCLTRYLPTERRNKTNPSKMRSDNYTLFAGRHLTYEEISLCAAWDPEIGVRGGDFTRNGSFPPRFASDGGVRSIGY